MKSTREKAEARARTMLALYKEGNTLHRVGQKYGVTRERVRQILFKKFGVRAADGGKAAKSRMTEAKRLQELDTKYLRLRGCGYLEYREAVSIGKQMMRAGFHRERTPCGAFRRQKENAKRRGIEWRLSFGQWWRIWKESGKFYERGRHRGGYVMSRFQDSGIYEMGNVAILPCTDNCRLARANKPFKKRPAEQRGVYLLYPGHRKPYVAKISKKYVGQFATFEEAAEARRIALAA